MNQTNNFCVLRVQKKLEDMGLQKPHRYPFSAISTLTERTVPRVEESDHV